ncbi:sialic acid-binding Ig-like lectin 10 isoform 4-T4 [Anomaloglossus baeobatrachus]|uniref:sialic acid-binding Ig-like lectin 10 isoform X5 n=1 Tax=Anomaloglossus baeobatrachus TaxID=238106 RepID=UPI003F4FF894
MQFTRLWISVDYLPLILIISQIWRNINCQLSEYKILVAPYVRVQRGLCVHVPCNFTVPRNISLTTNTSGIWYRVYLRYGEIVAFRRDTTYDTNGRFYLIGDVTRGDCSFYIEEPLSTDGGAYTFRIRDPQTQFIYTDFQPYVAVTVSPSINITIEGVDTDDPTTVIVKDGDSVTLNCIVDSNPNASVTWYKEDMVVHRNINDQIVTLQLINITESDAGKYQCSAMNEHGVTLRSMQIIHQSSYSHTEGSKYIIIISTCGAICLLLLGLVVYACWRRRLKNSRDTEMEATYTDLKISEITETYDQLKTVARSDTDVVESGVNADNDYENVEKQHKL